MSAGLGPVSWYITTLLHLEGFWQCLANDGRALALNPQVLPSLLGGSVRHAKAPLFNFSKFVHP